MKVEIENGKLALAINFLYDLKLARKQSRMRRRLINLLTERYKMVEEDRKELINEHSFKDEYGKAIIKKDGSYDIINNEAFNEDLKELYKEVFVIEGSDNREMIRTIKDILRKLENEEYQGETSDIYDYLCDAFQIDEVDESREN